MAFWKNDEPFAERPSPMRELRGADLVSAGDFQNPAGASVRTFEQGVLALLVIRLGAATGRPVEITRDEVDRLLAQRPAINTSFDPSSDAIRLTVYGVPDYLGPITREPPASVSPEGQEARPEGARDIILD